MNQNEHQKARRLLILGEDGSAIGEQGWLHAHLAECDECSQYGIALRQVASGLVGHEFAATFILVDQTTRRVRHGAMDWQRRQERARCVFRTSVGMVLLLAIMLRLSWTVFAYVGVRSGYSLAALEASFAYFWLVPTVAAGIAIVIGSVWSGEISHNSLETKS